MILFLLRRSIVTLAQPVLAGLALELKVPPCQLADPGIHHHLVGQRDGHPPLYESERGTRSQVQVAEPIHAPPGASALPSDSSPPAARHSREEDTRGKCNPRDHPIHQNDSVFHEEGEGGGPASAVFERVINDERIAGEDVRGYAANHAESTKQSPAPNPRGQERSGGKS